MRSIQSPSGATFPYYYKGGELFGMHLGDYARDEDGVIAMMHAEEQFLLVQRRRMGCWLDLCHTRLSDHVIAELVEMIDHLRPYLSKVALAGCSWRARWKINRLVAKKVWAKSLPLKYYEDPEVAKTWLVSER